MLGQFVGPAKYFLTRLAENWGKDMCMLGSHPSVVIDSRIHMWEIFGFLNLWYFIIFYTRFLNLCIWASIEANWLLELWMTPLHLSRFAMTPLASSQWKINSMMWCSQATEKAPILSRYIPFSLTSCRARITSITCCSNSGADLTPMGVISICDFNWQ